MENGALAESRDLVGVGSIAANGTAESGGAEVAVGQPEVAAPTVIVKGGSAAGRAGNERDEVAGIDDVAGRVVASDGVAGAAEEGP